MKEWLRGSKETLMAALCVVTPVLHELVPVRSKLKKHSNECREGKKPTL